MNYMWKDLELNNKNNRNKIEHELKRKKRTVKDTKEFNWKQELLLNFGQELQHKVEQNYG